MSKKQKLELTWVGKDNRPRLEPRILIEDADKSYHAAARVSENDIFDNLLIHGDNLLALKALEADYAGKVKCIFIDPPYNTGSAFEHYDDGLEHSIWLGLMRDRLEILNRLLKEDGSLWITLDDNEAHYFKVVCDEVFGRSNFIADIAWQKSFAKKNKALISGSHDHLLVYAKNTATWRRNLLPRDDAAASAFKNLDNDPRGRWQSVAYSVPSEDGERRKAYRYEIELPSGRRVGPPAGRHWNGLPERTAELIKDGRLWFGKDGNNPPRTKVFLSEVQDGIVPDTWWTHDQAGSTQDSKREMLQLFPNVEPFSTPKPEKLLRRILEISSLPGDIILDSFAGSGTTGAVSHKMQRRWIMVELGDHCATHIAPRLRQVVDGTDQGGISKSESWKGGGGFRYYELAPSLIEKDKWGREVISKEYDAVMLTQALCKLEGFAYAPGPDVYWQQGYSSEGDFLYVTTQSLGPEELATLSEDVGERRSLLILCAAFRGNAELWPNLTLRKIPNHIRSRCEWGHDDYSLNVASLPMAEPKLNAAQPGLFGEGDDA